MVRQSRWRLAAGSIAWRQFDDEAVVYHDSTGNTHHVGPLGCAVLRALDARPSGIGIDALMRELHADGSIEFDAALAVELERTLHELARLEIAVCEVV
jgi:PqqD family protein of HPr-rel-A system